MNDELDRIVAAHEAEIHKAPEHVRAQWHAVIDEAAALERGRSRRARPGWQPTSFVRGAAVTAALAVGIAIGFFVPRGDRAPADEFPDMAASAELPQAVSPALDRGIEAYLRDGGRLIASLDAGGRDSELVLQILEQNRLFEIAAERNGSAELARVLRAFEPILVQLAVSNPAPEEAAALRARLEFRMQAMLTKLTAPASDETHTT